VEEEDGFSGVDAAVSSAAARRARTIVVSRSHAMCGASRERTPLL